MLDSLSKAKLRKQTLQEETGSSEILGVLIRNHYAVCYYIRYLSGQTSFEFGYGRPVSGEKNLKSRYGTPTSFFHRMETQKQPQFGPKNSSELP